MSTVFVVNGASSLMIYMLTTLVIGVIIISMVNSNSIVGNMTIRKLFHVLAFALFYPGILSNVI
jgi:hypothetical protein